MEPRHIKLLRAAVKLAQAAPETDFLLDGEVYDALWLRGQVEDHLRAVEGLFSDTTEWPEPRPPYEDLLAQRQGCQDALRESFEVIQQEREAREKAEAERDELQQRCDRCYYLLGSILCTVVEGPEFMPSIQIYREVDKEANQAMRILKGEE